MIMSTTLFSDLGRRTLKVDIRGMNKDYVSVVYNETDRPKTDYPRQLAGHLASRFHLPKGAVIVDAGCGRGDFAAAFQDQGLSVLGLDQSPISARELQGAGIKVYQADVAAGAWPVPDGSADAVFSKSVIEHIHNPERFMKETYRVLKPGGRVITMTPDWESNMTIFYDDHTHVQPYTARALRKLLLMSGFREVTAEKFYQLPVYWRHPALNIVSRILQIFLQPNPDRKNKFFRWAVEPMCLASGVK